MSRVIVNEKINQSFVGDIFGEGSKEEITLFSLEILYGMQCNEAHKVIPFTQHILYVIFFFLLYQDSRKNSHPNQEYEKQRNAYLCKFHGIPFSLNSIDNV